MILGVRGSNPIWTEFNLQGLLFDDTYYLFILENTIPYLPKPVYHDSNLQIPWTNPIQFLSNGTLPIDIFFEQDVVYRLEFRQGPTQSDPLIYLVENYTPENGGGGTPTNSSAYSSQNLITNPQFSIISFTSPYSFTGLTNPDPIEVAPGWFLELSGTGNLTASRVALNSVNVNSSNAPYALRLQLAGWNSNGVFLRQRLQQNGMLWAGKTVSSAVTARIQGFNSTISAELVNSMTVPLIGVLASSTVTEEWVEFLGHGTLPATTNTDIPPAAYIDYKLSIANNVDIYISSIQLIVQDALDLTQPQFIQDTIERQVDHTFHYYRPDLIYKPIPSYLVGWDFPLNPAQFSPLVNSGGGMTTIGSNKSAYVWDQTIAFQTVANSLSWVRDLTTNALKISTANDTSFAIIQYLPGNVAREILSQRLCSQLNASVSTGTLSGTVSLFWTIDASLPQIGPVATPANNSLVSSIAAGVPTASNGTWNAVDVANNPSNSLPFILTTTNQSFDFTGFDDTATNGKTTATFFAIVIAFDTLPAASTVNINYCSLNGGGIPTRPAPQTPDQVLMECEHYFESSYSNSELIGTAAVNEGSEFLPMSLIKVSADVYNYPSTFAVPYNVIKYAVPNFNFYSPATGALANADAHLYFISGSGLTNVSTTIRVIPQVSPAIAGNFAQVVSNKSIYFVPITTAAMTTSATATPGSSYIAGGLKFHYTIDSRLGYI